MIRIYIVLIGILFLTDLSSQDEHFSQFYALPMHMNPALSGAYEGTYRMTAIYRDQWSNNLSSPYKTFAAGGDTRFKMKFGRARTDDHFGLGLFFVSDRVPEFQTNTTKVSSYFSYHKRLGDKNKSYIAAGAKLGLIQRNINYDNIFFQDQFNQIDAFDGITAENLPPNNIGVMDISVGLNYYINIEKTSYYIGAAAHHLTQPNISYFNRAQGINPNIDISDQLSRRLVVHASMDRQLSYHVSLQPRIVYQTQLEDNQIDLGTNVEYKFRDKDISLILGAWVTYLSDLDGSNINQFTPLLGIRQGLFIFGFSYDVSMRDTFQSELGLNSFEFSIRFSGIHSNENSICPTF